MFCIEVSIIRKEVLNKNILKENGENGPKDKSYVFCYICYEKAKSILNTKKTRKCSTIFRIISCIEELYNERVDTGVC